MQIITKDLRRFVRDPQMVVGICLSVSVLDSFSCDTICRQSYYYLVTER